MANVMIDEPIILKSQLKTVDFLINAYGGKASMYSKLFKDKYENNETIAFDASNVAPFSKELLDVFHKNLNRENGWRIVDLNDATVNKENIDITVFTLEKHAENPKDNEYLKIKGFLFTHGNEHTKEELQKEGIRLYGVVSLETLQLVSKSINSYAFDKTKIKPIDLAKYAKEANVELPKQWREEFKEVIEVLNRYGFSLNRNGENEYYTKDNISNIRDYYVDMKPADFPKDIRETIKDFDVEQAVDITMSVNWDKDGYYVKDEPYLYNEPLEKVEQKLKAEYSSYQNRLELVANELDKVLSKGKESSTHKLRPKQISKEQEQAPSLSH